jgi:putative nucleotidyltransferase with HDIG domain
VTPTRDQAWETLTRYTKSESLLRHALAVEASTGAYARRFGEDEELWRVCALLHDFDYEMHPTLDKHPQDGAPILREAGYPEEVVETVLSHAEHLGIPRDTLLKKTLFACDELSGFVHACGLVRPAGLEGLEPKSVRKKLKQPSFASGVNREDVYRGAEELGIELDGLVRRLPAPLQRRDNALLLTAFFASTLASQMVAVAVGWQVYAIRRNPFDLGLIGLAEFVPLPLLALPAGQLADRLSRRLVFAVSLVLEAVVAALLVVVTLAGATRLWPFLVLAAATGVAAALGSPAARALTPELVPSELLAEALALRSTIGQVAVVAGPALGGVLFALWEELVYALAAGLLVAALGSVLLLRGGTVAALEAGEGPPGLASLLAGIRFVRRTPVLLGAILLDLFAVLFGGAVALLPVFARTILHVGPAGLGILRSAPAVGAVLAGVVLTRRPLRRRHGRTLLWVVAAFGVSMVVFGISRSFTLSLAALAVSGFVDMISMNIRATTVGLAVPHELRGRVNAVEMVFISASNELGAFESGAAAALLGPVTAVVAGGVATIGIAAAWTKLFRPLAEVDSLEELRPPPTPREPERRRWADEPA